MADEPIKLGSNGLNTPPPYGTTNGRHIVGASPTTGTAWVGHGGEYAEEDGSGGYRFTGKAHMATMTFAYGGTVYTHSGSALVAQATTTYADAAGATAAAALNIETAVDNHGAILYSNGAAWTKLDAPATEGTWSLQLITSGNPAIESWAFSWQAVV